MKADGTYPAPVPHTLRQRVPKAQACVLSLTLWGSVWAQDLGVGIWVLGFGIWGLRFEVWDLA
eukprot:1453645-Rhodomonas_salina.2